ncbi:hypothetical protein IQ216_03150 [Cyanobium sp. LEGE 06143]|uniref:hypothetical protein n=1 Tax=Cyanobium sp. LEGE 06143 TaxID=945727 RepID=UPI0018812FCE|nr:hypothetical protein [Cyanobium sp. LEGE 06143]MBE9172113.1 hypothetical protein [Cyanobium sp. LEGE 06143]
MPSSTKIRRPSPSDTAEPAFAITCPVIKSEIEELADNISSWKTYKPFLTERPIDLTVYLDQQQPEEELVRINRVLKKNAPTSLSIEIIDASMTSNESIYIRNPEGKRPGWLGYKSGPNLQFLRNMYTHQLYDVVLQYEADCIPLSNGWAQQLISQTYRTCSCVMGSQYTGPSPMHLYYARHINGNALYFPSHALFPEYLSVVIECIFNCLNIHNEGMVAFDIALDLCLSRESEIMSDHTNDLLFRIRQILPYIAPIPHIANLSGDWETKGVVLLDFEKYFTFHPFTLLLHTKLIKPGSDLHNYVAALRKPTSSLLDKTPSPSSKNSTSSCKSRKLIRSLVDLINTGFMNENEHDNFYRLKKRCSDKILNSLHLNISKVEQKEK